MPIPPSDITELLQAWNSGDLSARDRLIPLVADELRAIARQHYQKERPDHTLQPTALVNELYLKLTGQRNVHWRNRKQFFAVASKLIRRILVDYARKRGAAKRGSDEPKISFDELSLPAMEEPALLELDDGLKDLEMIDPRGASVVELHIFGGLTFVEIADVIEVSRPTVMRDWKHARLWLRRHLRRAEPE